MTGQLDWLKLPYHQAIMQRPAAAERRRRHRPGPRANAAAAQGAPGRGDHHRLARRFETHLREKIFTCWSDGNWGRVGIKDESRNRRRKRATRATAASASRGRNPYFRAVYGPQKTRNHRRRLTHQPLVVSRPSFTYDWEPAAGRSESATENSANRAKTWKILLRQSPSKVPGRNASSAGISTACGRC